MIINLVMIVVLMGHSSFVSHDNSLLSSETRTNVKWVKTTKQNQEKTERWTRMLRSGGGVERRETNVQEAEIKASYNEIQTNSCNENMAKKR